MNRKNYAQLLAVIVGFRLDMIRRIPNRVCRVSETTRRWLKSPGFVAKASTTANKQTNSRTFAKPRKIASDAHISLRGVSPTRSLSLVLQVPSIALRVPRVVGTEEVAEVNYDS